MVRRSYGMVELDVTANFDIKVGTGAEVYMTEVKKRMEQKPGFNKILKKIGKKVEKVFEENITSGKHKGPDGKRWEDLSDDYQDEKMSSVGFVYPMLMRDDDMAESHKSAVTRKNEVIIWNDDWKASIHLNGLGPVPVRDWMYLEKEDEDWILKEMHDYVAIGPKGSYLQGQSPGSIAYRMRPGGLPSIAYARSLLSLGSSFVYSGGSG